MCVAEFSDWVHVCTSGWCQLLSPSKQGAAHVWMLNSCVHACTSSMHLVCVVPECMEVCRSNMNESVSLQNTRKCVDPVRIGVMLVRDVWVCFLCASAAFSFREAMSVILAWSEEEVNISNTNTRTLFSSFHCCPSFLLYLFLRTFLSCLIGYFFTKHTLSCSVMINKDVSGSGRPKCSFRL